MSSSSSSSTKNNKSSSTKSSSNKEKKKEKRQEEEDEEEIKSDDSDNEEEEKALERQFLKANKKEEAEEQDVIGNRSVCLCCTNETENLKPMFTRMLETDERKKEKIICTFCYNYLHMSFQVQEVCCGPHQEKEWEGVFLSPKQSLKRQQEKDRVVTFDEIKKTKRLCFDCIQDELLEWNTKQLKTLRKAYKMIKAVSKACDLCLNFSVEVKHRAPEVKLCELCVEDFQRAKDDPDVMCFGCRKNYATLSRSHTRPGQPKDLCIECIRKERLHNLIDVARGAEKTLKDEKVKQKLEKENERFIMVIDKYTNLLKPTPKKPKPPSKRKKKKKEKKEQEEEGEEVEEEEKKQEKKKEKVIKPTLIKSSSSSSSATSNVIKKGNKTSIDFEDDF